MANVIGTANGKVIAKTRVNSNGVLTFDDAKPGRKSIRIRPAR